MHFQARDKSICDGQMKGLREGREAHAARGVGLGEHSNYQSEGETDERRQDLTEVAEVVLFV